LERAIDLDPKNTDAWRGKSATLMAMGKFEDALEAYEKYIELDPKNADAWDGKGLALSSLGRDQEALEAYDKAIELDPKNESSWQGKGLALYSLKKYKDTLEAYEKAIELNPKDASAWRLKGLTLSHLKSYQKALEAFENAIKLDPKDEAAWHGKAEALYYIGSPTQAREAIDIALSYDKENPSFLNTKGVIYMRLGLYEDAAVLFEEAYRRRSEHRFIFNKAAALGRLQRFREVKDALQRALELASVATDEESRSDECYYRTQLERLRRGQYPTMWGTWWFLDEGWIGWAKRIFGGSLLLLFVIYMVLPLFTLNTELLHDKNRYLWINVGKEWQSYIVPVAAILILLP